jgi:cytochrome c oxidase subunit II
MFGVVNKILVSNYSFFDAPTLWAFGFQEPATPVMEGIDNFHSDLFFFMVVICTFVFSMLFYTIYTFTAEKNSKVILFKEHPGLEIIWTIIPTLILLIIVFPSLALLFATEDYIKKPFATFHVIGRQWYWTYEFKDCWVFDERVPQFRFDSYMIPMSELSFSEFRNLRVDKPLLVPAFVPLHFLVTSSDVIHSWAIPSAGIKVDACPGRLNQIFVTFKRTGSFYGQCSEICGVNHALMPIELLVVEPHIFLEILKTLVKSIATNTLVEVLDTPIE